MLYNLIHLTLELSSTDQNYGIFDIYRASVLTKSQNVILPSLEYTVSDGGGGGGGGNDSFPNMLSDF